MTSSDKSMTTSSPKPARKAEALNTNAYFKQLDGLRCIAVMSVIISHFIVYRAVVLIPLGSMGVNLFFVLSGFLITRILLLSKEQSAGRGMFRPIKQFYIRRTLRIFPIYYLTIFALYAMNFSVVRNIIVWLLTYTFNIKFALPNVWESGYVVYFAHLWSLSVEEQYYLFFPFLVFLVRKKNMRAFFVGMIVLGIVSRLVLYLISAPSNAIYVLTPCCFDAFGIGALLAYYFLYEYNQLKAILAKTWVFVGLCIVFIADIVYSRNFIPGYGECRTVLERFLFSILCFWMVGKAVDNGYRGTFRKFLENRFVLYIGRISYGLYIFHHFANIFLHTFLERRAKWLNNLLENNMLLNAVILFICTLTVASISWFFIEKPINGLKSKFQYKNL